MAAPGTSCLRWAPVCAVLLACLSQTPAALANNRNYYETLDVEPTATDRQIKKAFRKLAVKYHPDKNRSVDAEKTFREIAEAYKVLSDQENRRLYDHLGHQAFLNNGDHDNEEDTNGPSFHFSFSDMFQDWDEGAFMEEPHFHYHSPQGWGGEDEVEGEEGLYEHYSFEGADFSFLFEDEFDEENHYETT